MESFFFTMIPFKVPSSCLFRGLSLSHLALLIKSFTLELLCFPTVCSETCTLVCDYTLDGKDSGPNAATLFLADCTIFYSYLFSEGRRLFLNKLINSALWPFS